MKTKRPPNQTIRALHDEYLSGPIRLNDIAARFSVKSDTIANWFHYLGLPIKPKSWHLVKDTK